MNLTEGLHAANDALEAGNSDAALAALTPLLQAYPDTPAVRWTAGRYFGLHKSYASASEQFLLAVEGDPTFSHVEFAVGSKVVRLRDVPGSPWAAKVLAEFARGMYKLSELSFAPGSVAVDVGAHIGGVSVILATLHPDLRIISYEPSSSNFAMLCANIQRNAITNVTPVQQAVMGARGQMTLTWSERDTAGAAVGLLDAPRRAREADGWRSETVQCVTLDDVMLAHGIDRCAWLKLDCEGAEWEIAAKTGVLERIDHISMELHIPASRRPAGVEHGVREFAALVNRVPKAPPVLISSTVWIDDGQLPNV
jgi:FkbM family methyltransferase